MHHRTLAGAFLAALLLPAVPAARAQFDEAQPGARVRIEAPGIVAGRYVGVVLAREPRMMRIGSQNAQPIEVPIDRLTSLELSRGSSRWGGVGRGALWGTPIGAAFGLVAALGDASDRTYFNYDTGKRDTTTRGAIVVYSAFSGAVIGGLIGALIPKERWERFDLAPRTGVDTRRRRLQLGFSVGY